MTLELNKIHCGHVMDLSDKLDENSVNTIVTSPPYWALRFYDIPPSIWDADPNCEHEWKEYTVKVEMYNNKKRIHWQNKGVSRKTTPEGWDKTLLRHKICMKCKAWEGWLGLEPDFNMYVKHLCDIFENLKRPLRDDGTLWVNLGDTHYTKSGSGFHFDRIVGKQPEGKSNIHIANQIRGLGLLPSKCLVLAPFRFAVEMCNRGWILRNVIIWQKNNVIPNSAKDRFTVDFEYLFFFTQNRKYYFKQQLEPYKTPPKQQYRPNPYPDKTINKDGESTGGQGIHDGKRKREDFFKVGGRNKRTVWNINTKPCKEAHFAVFPPELVKIPIDAGCPDGGTVLDPFAGTNTTGRVARSMGKNYIGFDISEEYCGIAELLMLKEIEWEIEDSGNDVGDMMLR